MSTKTNNTNENNSTDTNQEIDNFIIDNMLKIIRAEEQNCGLIMKHYIRKPKVSS